MLPKRYWHFADKQLVIANTGILTEISKGLIIRHPSITVKGMILFNNYRVHLSDVGNIYITSIWKQHSRCTKNLYFLQSCRPYF